MGWTLPKPWENGYTSVVEQRKGTQDQGQNNRIRVWKRTELPVEPAAFNDEFKDEEFG